MTNITCNDNIERINKRLNVKFNVFILINLYKGVFMNQKEFIYIEKKLNRLSEEIWNVDKLCRVLYELLTNGDGNLTGADICTLSYILTRTSNALLKQTKNLKLQLKI